MSAVKKVSSKYNLGKWDYKGRTGWKDFDIALEMAIEGAVKDVKKKARQWAKNTYEDWRKNVPVDTGNLQDSIDIEDNLDDAVEPYILVGVNEDKLLGVKYMRSKKFKNKTFIRRIPPYNYVPYAEKNASDENLKFFVQKLWMTYAEKEAERIFK